MFCLVWILPGRLAFYVAFIAITFTYCQFALCTRRACTGFSLRLPYILNEQSLCAISSERPRIHTSRLDWPFIHIAQPFYFLYLIRALTTNCSWMLIVAIIKALTCRFRDCVRRMCRLWHNPLLSLWHHIDTAQVTQRHEQMLNGNNIRACSPQSSKSQTASNRAIRSEERSQQRL